MLWDKNNATSGSPSSYTSWGPTLELGAKPQIIAPGSTVISLVPLSLGSFAIFSGTSMAAPLAAAIMALVAQVRQTLDPILLNNVLSATANPALFLTQEFLGPVAVQGRRHAPGLRRRLRHCHPERE